MIKKNLICLSAAIVLVFTSCGTQYKKDAEDIKSQTKHSGDISDDKENNEKAQKQNELLASFSTPLVDSNEDRINNINIALNCISGKTLMPGEEFSFNNTVGERTAEKGYRKAAILVDGKKEIGLGGGICQVSTTMYNAVLSAGLEITERHKHSGKLSYIESGKDACVLYGSMDFKFKNNKGHNILINVYIRDDDLVAEILAT